MSLIPFILELADELHEFNRCLATGGMVDVDDFGFGIYPHELQQPQQQQQYSQQHLLQQTAQQQQQQQRRPRAVSQFYWLPSSISKSRHHPYCRSKLSCCPKSATLLLHDPEKEVPIGMSATIATTAPTADKDTSSTTTNNNNNSANANANTTVGSPNVAATATAAAGKSAYSVVNKNGFQVSMNVKQFAPNELTVKTIDNCIVVEGQHEDKEDGHGVISRHFIRKYMLPKGYDPNEVLSTLSSDGILTVKAPPPATKTDEPMERIVDIQQTGPTQVVAKDAAAAAINKGESPAKAAATTSTVVTLATGTAPTTTASTGATVTAAIPITATVTQQQQQQQKSTEDTQQSQKQQQQQQQPQTKDLENSFERNGIANATELLAEQETEPAEPVATSSNSINSNNIGAKNSSSSSNSNSNNNAPIPAANTNSNSITISNSNTNANSNSNSCEAEPTMLLISSVTVTPTAIDAIMAAATADEAEDQNEDANANANISSAASVATTNNTNSINTVNKNNGNATDAEANSEADLNADVDGDADADGDVDMNADVDAEAEMDVDAEAVDAAKVASGNGLSGSETNTDIAVIPVVVNDVAIVGVEKLPCAVVDSVAAVADAEKEDGVKDDGISDGVNVNVGVGVGVDVDVGMIADDAMTGGVENLVVAARPPSAADLVAAADAAILLSKTQCENGTKPMVTEEITN